MRRGAVYPPHISHRSTRLSTQDALARIQAYLDTSETSSYLHPDALIEPGGIVLRSSAGPQGGIVMHHLRRIAAGLDGQVLAIDAEELMFTQGQDQSQGQGQGRGTDSGRDGDAVLTGSAFPRRWKSNVGEDGMPIKSALKRTASTDGQDPDVYALGQEIVEGEGGDGHPDGAPVARRVDAPPAIEETRSRMGAPSKEARKADKKARRKKEKSAREEARKTR